MTVSPTSTLLDESEGARATTFRDYALRAFAHELVRKELLPNLGKPDDHKPISVKPEDILLVLGLFRSIGDREEMQRLLNPGRLTVIYHKGEIMQLKITPGNHDDRAPMLDLTASLTGKILADKGYISKKLFDLLWQQGLHLVTGIRKNMKNHLMPMVDKLLLRKRYIIETLFGKLKQNMGLEHSRHRSISNAMVHVLSCLAAYTLGKPKSGIKDIAYP